MSSIPSESSSIPSESYAKNLADFNSTSLLPGAGNVLPYGSIEQRTYQVSLSIWGEAIADATPWFSMDLVKVIANYLDSKDDYNIGMQLLTVGKTNKAFACFHWLSNSFNHRPSQDQCASMLLSRTGIQTNPQEGIRFLRMAAAHDGASSSWLKLAVELETLRQNPESILWYTKAADAGHTIAQYNLGKIHLEGRGVPVDRGAALFWFRKASAETSTQIFTDTKNRAALQAAFIYTQNGNYDNAAALLTAARHLPEAAVVLASRFCTGIGRGFDLDRAQTWLGHASRNPALVEEDGTALQVAEFLLTLSKEEMHRSLSFFKPRCDFQNPVFGAGSPDGVVQCTQVVYGNKIPTSTRTVHLHVFDRKDLPKVSLSCGQPGIEGYALNVEFLDPSGTRIRLPLAQVKLPPSPGSQ